MKARLFQILCYFSAVLLFVVMGFLLGFIVYKGLPTLGLELFFGDASVWSAVWGRELVWEGIWPACIGTLMVTGLSLLMVFFPGIATGIWLAEYSDSGFAKYLGVVVDVLAGIPSIVMGLFGFTMILLLRQTIAPSANACMLLSAVCLAVLVLPYLAGATRTALQALPFSLRFSASALGMTREQTLCYLLLPRAARGIGGGVMLSMGRAAEDTAVIMLTGVVANAGLPDGLFGRYEALPFTIFYYSSQYQSPEELGLAFGAALTLLICTATGFTLAGAISQKKFMVQGGYD